MANEQDGGVEKQGEGLAASFVSILGLVEIVIGGLTLYLVRLRLGTSAMALFPTTGYAVIDVALLACAASLTGRLLALTIAIGMAVINRLMRKTKQVERLLEAIANYEKRTKRSPNTALKPLDYGAALLTTDTPARQPQLERVRATAILSYAASILAFPYAHTVISHPTLASSIRWAGAMFLLIGLLQQLDYINTVATLLAAGGNDAGANPPN